MGKRGVAESSICPKAGHMVLVSDEGEVATTKTNCKAWGCVSCRDRVRGLLMDRIEYGVSCLQGPSWFITLTFKTVGSSRRDAQSVERVFRRWCAFMRQSFPNLTWLKVVEFTKRSQCHLHLIVGGLGEMNTKCRNALKKTYADFMLLPCHAWPPCLNHVVSGLWYASSGDSYITHAMRIHGPKGISRYMGKYVTKQMVNRPDMEAAGFKRRWSVSRNWPRYEGLKFKGTKEGTWKHTHWFAGEAKGFQEAEGLGGPFEKMGDDRTQEMAADKAIRGFKRMVKKLVSEHEKNTNW